MASGSKDYAAELRAMGAIMEALESLDREAQASVVLWVLDKLDLRSELAGKRIGDAKDENDGEALRGGATQTRAGTINTVATKIGADSCRTLLIAAALHLTLFQGKESFSRSELVSLARSAKVWKSDYTSQTSTMIGRLADAGTLVEKSKDIYFLSDVAISEYQPAIS